jgi:hypothetical protein
VINWLVGCWCLTIQHMIAQDQHSEASGSAGVGAAWVRCSPRRQGVGAHCATAAPPPVHIDAAVDAAVGCSDLRSRSHRPGRPGRAGFGVGVKDEVKC